MELNIRRNILQIGAIWRINLLMRTRLKVNLIMMNISALIHILFPLFMFGFLFGNILGGRGIGVFSAENYISLVFLGFCGGQFGSFFVLYSRRFSIEKRTGTLSALIIAPFNRFNLLSGIFLSNLVFISPVFSAVFIFNIIFSPTIPSFGVILFIFLVYLLYALTLSGLGLILGILVISKQNWVSFYRFIYGIITIFNCAVFPKEIFPELLHPIIELNPFYHVFEIVRVLWVFGDFFYSGVLYHIIYIISFSIVCPVVGIYLFNKIYNRYGIRGI